MLLVLPLICTVGCLIFALTSGSYLLLLRLFSGRPNAIAHT